MVFSDVKKDFYEFFRVSKIGFGIFYVNGYLFWVYGIFYN